MVSSHILPELADICNKIGMIEKGVLIVNTAVADVLKLVRQQTVLHVGVVGDQLAAAKLLEQHPLVARVEESGKHLVVTLTDGQHDYSDLATTLVSAGHKLTMLKEDEINLETAFMALTKGITS